VRPPTRDSVYPGAAIELLKQGGKPAGQARSTSQTAVGGQRKSLYDDDALQTMLRQAKEADIPFFGDAADESEDESSSSSGSEEEKDGHGTKGYGKRVAT
jgi:hypothetical protein